MIELKFRYCYRLSNGERFTQVFTLDQIETGLLRELRTHVSIDRRDRFIGLVDKTGRDIFENDIVQNFYGFAKEESRCIVTQYKKEWRLCSLKHFFNAAGEPIFHNSGSANICDFTGGLVIGDTYMRPELMKKEGNKWLT